MDTKTQLRHRVYWILGVFLVVFVILMNPGSRERGYEADKQSQEKQSQEKQAQRDEVDAYKKSVNTSGNQPVAYQWTYSTSEKDNMSGNVWEHAELFSDTVLDFAFPYNGGSTVLLTIARTSGKKDTNLLNLEVSKGQFACIGGCRVNMKFDNGPVQGYPGKNPDTGEANVLFIFVDKSFVKQLKKSKHLIIEVPFYNYGLAQIEFSTAGLKW